MMYYEKDIINGKMTYYGQIMTYILFSLFLLDLQHTKGRALHYEEISEVRGKFASFPTDCCLWI